MADSYSSIIEMDTKGAVSNMDALTKQVESLGLKLTKLSELTNIDKSLIPVFSKLGSEISRVNIELSSTMKAYKDAILASEKSPELGITASIQDLMESMAMLAPSVKQVESVVSMLDKSYVSLTGSTTAVTSSINQQIASYKEVSSLASQQLSVQSKINSELSKAQTVLKSTAEVDANKEKIKSLNDYIVALKKYKDDAQAMGSLGQTGAIVSKEDVATSKQWMDELNAKVKTYASSMDLTREKVSQATRELEKNNATLAQADEAHKKVTFSGTEWLKNVAKRTVAYYGMYQAMQSVISMGKSEIQYLIDVDTASRTFAAISDVRGNYNDRLTEGMRIEKSMIGLVREYGGALKDVNQAAMDLTRAGTKTGDIEAATRATMLLAKLTGDTISTSASAMVTYTQVYSEMGATTGKASYSVEQLGDKLAYMANQSRMTTQDIGTFSNYALATATAAGLSIDAINGMAIALSNAGFNASTVGTQIRKFTNILTSTSTDATEFFEKMGINQEVLTSRIAKGGEESNAAFTEFIQKIGSVTDEEFNKIISKMDLLEKNVLLGLKSNALNVINQMNGSITLSVGELQKAQIITEGYAASWERAKITMQSVVGEAFTPILKSINSVIGGLLENKDAIDTQVKAWGMMASEAVGGIAIMITAVKALQGALLITGATLAGVTGAIGLVVAAGAALYYGVGSLYDMWNDSTKKQVEEQKKVTDALVDQQLALAKLAVEEQKLADTRKASESIRSIEHLAQMGKFGEDNYKGMLKSINAVVIEYAKLNNMDFKTAFDTLFPVEKINTKSDAVKDVFSRLRDDLKISMKLTSEDVNGVFNNILSDNTIASLKKRMGITKEVLNVGNFFSTELFATQIARDTDKVVAQVHDTVKQMRSAAAVAGMGGEDLKIFDKLLAVDSKTATDIQAVGKNLADTYAVIGKYEGTEGFKTVFTGFDKAKDALLTLSKNTKEYQDTVKKNQEDSDKALDKTLENKKKLFSLESGGEKLKALQEEKKYLIENTSKYQDQEDIKARIAKVSAEINKESGSQQIKATTEAMAQYLNEHGRTVDTLGYVEGIWKNIANTVGDYNSKQEASNKALDVQREKTTAQEKSIDNMVKSLLAYQKLQLELLTIANDLSEATRERSIIEEKAKGNNTELLEARNAELNALANIQLAEQKILNIQENKLTLQELLSKKSNMSEDATKKAQNDLLNLDTAEQKSNVDRLRAQNASIQATKQARDVEMERSDSFSNGWTLANEKFLQGQQTTAQQAMAIYGAMTSSMTSSFTDFFDATSDGFMDFKKLAVSVMQAVLREIIQVMIVKQLVSGIMGIFTGDPTGGAVSSSTSTTSADVVSVPQSSFRSIGGIASSGGFEKFASGYIAGNGYSSIDSQANDTIPAMISKGEAVIPASTVSNNRGLIETLISGRGQKFADGYIANTGTTKMTSGDTYINITNSTGVPVNLEELSKRQDDKGNEIRTYVMKFATSDPEFRTALGISR